MEIHRKGKASISKNIPSERRWKILELADSMIKWGGYPHINARQTKEATTISYNGLTDSHIITCKNDADFDDIFIVMERVSLAHRERMMAYASHLKEREMCDWDEKTQTMVDDEGTSHQAWRFKVLDGMRHSIDKGLLTKENIKNIKLIPKKMSTMDYDEDEFEWDAGNQTKVKLLVERSKARSEYRIEQIKHDDQTCYFSYGKSLHYVKVAEIPSALTMTLEHKRAENIINHPFIGPADTIKKIKTKKGASPKSIINLQTIRQYAEQPPINDMAECHEIISFWDKKGYW